jgi:uncharacterized protein YggL (DUF469 family)
MPRHRTRRLRKKLRVGEFTQLGFEVSFSLRNGLTEDDRDRFWDAFILELIEPNGLAYGGGTNGFVSGWGRESASEPQRELVRRWLAARPEVVSAEAGSLVDAWHLSQDAPAL